MNHEEFAHLFEILSIRHPEEGFQYDGKDTISTRFPIFGFNGIWINIGNDQSIDTDDYWSTSICLKNANGQLWERHIADLAAEIRRIDELISKAIFREKIYEAIIDKAIFSNISREMVEVVRVLPDEIVKGKVLFDGIMLFDGIDICIEDDIQQMHAFTKDGKVVNLEDYYTANGAFDEDGEYRFLEALDELMTIEEYSNE